LTRIARTLVLAFVLTGCTSGPHHAHPTPSVPAHARPIDRAITHVNSTGRRIDTAMNTVVGAANTVDNTDHVSTTGRWSTLSGSDRVAPAQVDAVVAALPERVRAFEGALDLLEARIGSSDLARAQVDAVRQVLVAGRGRADADEAFVRTSEIAWPVYAMFAGRQALWYDRASTGWYRSTDEAAAAYAVATQPLRHSVDNASRLFAATDRARRDATAEYAATVAALRPVLGGGARR
jgi:hypothetical protein